MTNGKQKTPDNSETPGASTTCNEFQVDVSSESSSGENLQTENLRTTAEVHPPRISFVKQSREQGIKKRNLSEIFKDQPLKHGQKHERKHILENEQSKSKNLRSKGILRTGAVKKSNNPGQRDLESGEDPSSNKTYLQERIGKLRQDGHISGKDLESGGIYSNIDAHVVKEGNAYENNGVKLHKTGRTSTIFHRHQRRGEGSESEKNGETTAGKIPSAEDLNSVTKEQTETVSRWARIFPFHLRDFLKYYRSRYARRLKKSRERIREWWKTSTCRRQLTEEWMYYILWLGICHLCLIWAAYVFPQERDIPICITMVITFCCGDTLLCKRECLADWLKYTFKRVDAMGNAERLQAESVRLKEGNAYENSFLCPKCLDSFSLSSEEYHQLPRRRQRSINRRTELENRNTTFKHEVVDVSKLKPEECPQIRQVEIGDSEFTESVSSDSPKERLGRKDKATVHFYEAETQRKLDEWICKTYNIICSIPEGERQTRVIPHIKYVHHAKKPESKNIPKDEGVLMCEHYGQDVICDCIGLDEIEKTKSPLRKPADDVSNCEYCGNDKLKCICHEVLEKNRPEVNPRGESSPEEDFICLHYGQAVACGCFELAKKSFEDFHDDMDDGYVGKKEPVEVSSCKYCGNDKFECICHELLEKNRPETSRRESSPEEDFMCPHHGQAVACNCFELAKMSFEDYSDDMDDGYVGSFP